jgi:hypothetical protein
MLFLFAEYLPYQPGDENIVFDSTFLTPVKEILAGQPQAELFPCQPNPAAGYTRIPFYLPEKQEVSIRVLDVSGRQVAVPLAKTRVPAGYHAAEFFGGLSPGIYFVSLEGEGGLRKMAKFAARTP